MPTHRYDWHRPAWGSAPDRPIFVPPRRLLIQQPPMVDWLPKLGPVLDQGSEGSCGPNSVDGLIMFDQLMEGAAAADVASRQFIYWITRVLMGTTGQDSGVDNVTMFKALEQYGYCYEDAYPYNEPLTQQPPQSCFDAALPNKVIGAIVPQDLNTMRAALAAGHCFVYGFTVYASFESPQTVSTGDVPMPSPGESVLGGHDVLFYGYDDSTQRFKFRNSWGAGFGKGGNGTFPYAYATDPNLSSDFHTIVSVPSPPGPGPSPPPGPAPLPVPVTVAVGARGNSWYWTTSGGKLVLVLGGGRGSVQVPYQHLMSWIDGPHGNKLGVVN